MPFQITSKFSYYFAFDFSEILLLKQEKTAFQIKAQLAYQVTIVFILHSSIHSKLRSSRQFRLTFKTYHFLRPRIVSKTQSLKLPFDPFFKIHFPQKSMKIIKFENIFHQSKINSHTSLQSNSKSQLFIHQKLQIRKCTSIFCNCIFLLRTNFLFTNYRKQSMLFQLFLIIFLYSQKKISQHECIPIRNISISYLIFKTLTRFIKCSPIHMSTNISYLKRN